MTVRANPHFRQLALVFTLAVMSMTVDAAESGPALDSPGLEHVLTVRANVESLVSMGTTPAGERRVVPISSGTFEGPGLRGTIMPGGEDWQLVRPDGVTELDARYWLRTDDGVLIRVQNQVLSVPANSESAVKPYARSSVRFEAPIGRYDWLNKAIFVGTITVERAAGAPPVVVLRFFKVS